MEECVCQCCFEEGDCWCPGDCDDGEDCDVCDEQNCEFNGPGWVDADEFEDDADE